MNNYEKITNMNLDEMADWLVDNGVYDEGPWVKDFCKKYCDNCEPSIQHNDYFDSDVEVGFCETHHFCRFFPESKDVPSVKDEIVLWLKSEA